MSSSLGDKVARNPLRFGMIIGFLGIPVLWMLGDSLVRIMMGQGALPIEAFWGYEASGALVGVFLGGQGMRIWAHWRAGRIGEARGLAVMTGGLGTALYVAWAALAAGVEPYFFQAAAWRVLSFVTGRNLPFLLCLLLLFGGLCAPRK